jgi:hypothetical protein
MTRRLSTTKPFSCATCRIEIPGRVTFHLGLPFCCAGCAAGGPCTCSYDDEPRADAQVRHCLDVVAALSWPLDSIRTSVSTTR